MKFRRQKHEDNFLLYIPQKKHITWENSKGKVKLLFYHDKAIEKFMRWLVKKPRTSDVLLDDIGSTTWNLIDGNNSVYDISKKLFELYGERCNPDNDTLIMFLRHLNRKGWISFERGNQNR